MKFLFGKVNKCPQDANGNVMGKPSTMATLFFVLVFLGFLGQVFSLFLKNTVAVSLDPWMVGS